MGTDLRCYGTFVGDPRSRSSTRTLVVVEAKPCALPGDSLELHLYQLVGGFVSCLFVNSTRGTPRGQRDEA